MDQRRAAGALLALAVCIASTAAAPTVSNHTVLDLYEGSPEGCYYNFQHYGEGDRIMTNEPCLNCTCHNRMLMCYLRVCPFTKPIGQDCTVEKRADQCCPIVTCPDVPVDLLTSTSTTSPAEYGATGVGKLDKYGCSINGKYFPEGAKVPPTPNKPCEHCYCIRNMTTCVMQECTLHVDGCTPIYHKDVCCPVRYSCDHPEDTTLFLDDMTTTVRPTPGFLLTTTTLSPVTQMSQDCVHDDQIFSDGALIKTEKACEHCYCMKGDIVCVVQECGMPMENEGKNCTSQTPREGQCCPDTYICEGDDFTTEPPSEFTTQSLLEELTTLTPPRRVGVEGSGYRKETEQPAETEAPSIETEPEGSGYEEPAEPAAVDENLASETPETITETIDESFYSSRTTVRTPILEEVEKTTEPDKGLNTVPSDASDEEIYKPTFTEKTPFEEPEVTEYTPTEDKKPDDGEEKTASPEEVFTQAVTVKSEESDITTETAFRKEDALGEPTEIYDLGEPENTSTQATYIEKDAEKDDTSSKTKAPFMEELEKQTTSPPLEFTQKDIEQETPSKESTTESVLEVATSAYVKPTEEISSKASTTESVLEVTTSAYVKPTDKLTTDATEPSETESTRPTVEKEDLPETTDSDQNEVEDISTTLPPGRIPGEGDCLLNDITYRNNSNVPSTNNCHTSCRCVSSIVKCDPIICSPPPEYMDNCQPTYDSPDACCPTYVCHTGETMPPQPHSQMSGTDSPLLPHPVVCHGDECAIRKDDNVPVVGDCGSAGCGEGHGIPETQPESCQDGKCSYPAQPCIDGNCQETPTAHCENGKCGIEPEIVPVKDKPLCENESDCKVTVPEVPLCDGEHCDGVNVGCVGTECSLDGTQQPSIPEQGGESCNEDCKTPEGETSEPCAETPCRRKESGEVDTAIPSECIGSECIQKVPSKKDDVNVISTESPVTEGTSAKSTQELEMTTKASEDASGYGPTEMDEHALDEGSTSGPLPEATVKPETSDDKYSGTEASTELDRTTESQLDKDVTKSPIEKESSTSEPPISVTGAITNEPEETASKIHEDSPVTESQDFTTKAQSQESIETGTTQHVMHSDSTESPHDTDDVRTAGPLEYSTSLPEIEDTNAELPHEEHTTKASEQQKPESELPQEPEKPDVYKVTEESVAYTPEMDMASTKLPESDVKQDVTESYAPQVTDTSHDVTESNEVVEKATKVPESVDSDEHKVTEMFQHEPTTEGATVVTGAQEQETVTSHATSSENDLEQAPFTNAPTESSLNDRTEITESVTEKITEASTASSSSRTTEDTSDLSSKSPEEYNTEKQDHFTESPGEYITEPQETSTKQPALAGEEPELTTDETIRETEQPTSDEDAQSQITSAPPVVDVKIKDDDLSSQTETKEEGTTQASVFEEKTTVSQPAEIPVLDDEKKQPTESFESNDVSEESSEKPAMTESLDSLTTKQPSKIPTYDDSTDVPATQDITDQQEISTEEPSLESVPPITDELPSEPYLPVHPETIPELPSAQTDITNEIPDTEQESQTPASDKEVEIETKIPDRSGLDEATKLPEIVDTESPEVKVPDTVKEEAATQAPEVYSETPAVHKEEETEPTRKPFETETSPAPVDEIPEKTPETMAPEQEEKDLVTTEKIQEQPLDNEQTSAPEIYATVSVVQDTTVSSVAQQETSEQPEVTESDISYATSAPESHVKEPQKPVSETAETYTTESHISDETSTEGSQEVSSGASEKPSEEKLSVYHGEQPEEKPEIQYERSTVLPEIITEAEQEVKPQEPQEEDKEDSVVTEPSPYKTTEAHIDIITSAISDQEKMTSDGLQETMTTLQESSTRTPSHDVTTSPDLEFPEKYTVAVTDEPVQQETSSPHADSTEKLLEVEDVEKQPTTLKTPLIDEAETSPEQVDKEVTKEPTLYETQSPDITEKESDAYSPATESSDKEQTTPEIVELEEHSHKPLEETSTVGVTEEEITDLQEHHFDEEKEKPQTEKPAAVTTSDEDGISTPSKEYSPEITKVTSDVGEIPSESTPRPSGEESGQDSNVPTTSQPTIEVGDTRFGDDTSQEEPQPTKASPESELTPVSEIEIPVQTERVPSEKITESELSHETLMLEEISPVTTKQEKESTTQGPEYSLPDVTPLVEKPEKEPSEKPEESSEKPSDEETVQSGEELEKRPSEETEKVPTESPLEEPAVTASEKPLTEEKPAETPEQKPLEEEIPAETPQKEAEGVTTETSLTESDKTPEEKLEEKPFEATEKTPVEEPTEGTDEKLAEKPDEQPEVRPVDESEEKPTEKPFDAEEKPLEAEEKPVESPEKKPQEIPDEEPLRTPEEKPSEMPEEKPLEIPEEKPLETPEEKPQEAEEKPQEYPEETSEVPTEKPLEVSEEQTQEAPEEKPQELPEEKPEEAPEEKPQDVPTETPQETLEQKPQEVPEEKPEEQPEEKPEEKIQVAPEGKPQLVPEEKPEEGAEEEPQETPEEKPLETPEEKPLETPEEKPLETPEEKPLETPEEKPLETPEEKPLETPEEKPQESPEEKPLETPEEKPLETPEEKPLETPEEKPQEVPEEKPSELPEETTGVPTEKPLEEPIEKPAETPEMTTQVPDEKKQEIPEEKPEEIPEEKPLETPEEKPLETPEEKPQEVPEEKPSELPEETTGIPTEKPLEEPIEKPEETPEMTTQVPDKKKQETPEEEPEEIPEEKPQEVPETQPQEIPEEKPQELPEVPKEAPQEVPEEKPQEVPEEKPQESPKDKPEEIPEEKPEEKPQEEAEQKPQDVPEEKPAEPASTASPDISRPGFADMEPTDEVPDDFPPSGGTSGYGTEPEYVEEDQAFGPGTCRYGGKVYVSAQQIPRDDPCDFCFCFRSDIICLQQSCPPPIHGCHEEPIQGFCCPRYECPVAMATTLNVTTTTTTTTTTLPPHFLPHAYKGAAQRRGCQIKGHTYKVGEVVRASSGPCLHCTCGGDGQMKCDPKACTPEPMLRQMIAAAVSAKRRR